MTILRDTAIANPLVGQKHYWFVYIYYSLCQTNMILPAMMAKAEQKL